MTTDTKPADIEVQVNRGYGITIEALTDAAIHWLENDIEWERDSADQPWAACCDTSVGVVVALDAQRRDSPNPTRVHLARKSSTKVWNSSRTSENIGNW